MENTAAVEKNVEGIFFLFNFDIVDESMIGELARKVVRKILTTVRILRYYSQLCFVSIIKAL